MLLIRFKHLLVFAGLVRSAPVACAYIPAHWFSPAMMVQFDQVDMKD